MTLYIYFLNIKNKVIINVKFNKIYKKDKLS
jgi:hypothetical protein